MPSSSELFQYFRKNKQLDPIMKALRFLMLSNYGYMGKPETFRLNNKNTKRNIYNLISNTHDYLFDVEFFNSDFNVFLKSISFKDNEIKDVFIYNDPPYLGTGSNYENKGSWNEKTSFDLFEVNQATGCKWAMSEFDHPFILEQAKERNLNVIYIGERQNLKNRRTEILVTNYANQQLKLFK